MGAIFEGIKVIDAASFLAGPCAATIMSDYGADVIKVEPFGGDRHRSIAAGHPSDFSWQLTGRNKRSLAVDITTDAGYQTLLELIRQADVFLVNFSEAQVRKFKLDWPTLRAVNPRLVFAQITAYGRKGADAERRAFDLTGWFARTGILDMMRDKDVPPTLPAGGVGDHATAMTLFAGIMLALYQRDRTGEGAMVDTSLLATGVWANGLNLQPAMAGLDNIGRRNKEGWSNPMQNVYACADGQYLFIALQNIKRDWPKLCAALGHPEWPQDERFAAVKPLMRNRAQVRQMLADAIATFTFEQMAERLNEIGIVYSQVAPNPDVIEDPQVHANNIIVDFDSGVPGVEQTFATPINLSTQEQRSPQRAPNVGQHTREVLLEFGFDAARIDALLAAGAIQQGQAPADASTDAPD